MEGTGNVHVRMHAAVNVSNVTVGIFITRHLIDEKFPTMCGDIQLVKEYMP